MVDLIFASRAPSNIAWVKYMGKREGERAGNLPANGSVSMTLDSLCTVAEVVRPAEKIDLDTWEPVMPSAARGLGMADLILPLLNDSGRERVLRHVKRIKDALPELLARQGLEADREAIRTGWRLRAANTFPEASGIASSASSFAAITLSVARAGAKNLSAFDEQWKSSPALRRELARLSRQGSGSSCRSMEGPIVAWAAGDDPEAVEPVKSRLPAMAHFVMVVSAAKKEVSSSEAHSRVKSSPLWQGRVERASERARAIRAATESGDLGAVSRIAWEESWEMHSLFHTSNPPFTYWESGSLEVLKALSTMMSDDVPPIVTMDAGPNVHVSVPETEAQRWESRLKAALEGKGQLVQKILRDRQGRGAMPL